MVGLLSDLVAQLLHFPMGVSILQRLTQDIGHIRGMDTQSRHGTDGQHGLHGQLFVLRLIFRLLTSLGLNPQLGSHRFHILCTHPGRHTVGKGLGNGINIFFVIGQGFGQLVCIFVAVPHGFHSSDDMLFLDLLGHAFHGFAHYRFCRQPCFGSIHDHLLGTNSILFLEAVLNHQCQHFPGLGLRYAKCTHFTGLLLNAFHGLL